jgi:predicted MFS family arabinose efflux permease
MYDREEGRRNLVALSRARPPLARGPFSVLRHRDFALLFGGTLVSHSGDLLQAMAQSWLVFQLTHSAVKLGWLGFCQLVPRLLFAGVGGVIVDRFDRRKLLIWTQTAAMLQSILFWLLVATGHAQYWHVVVLAILLGTADTLHLTARHALIPLLVPGPEVQQAVAINSAGMNLTQVIGPSLGGVLLGLVGVSGCLGINAISFVAILLALLAMQWRPLPREAPARADVMADLKEGIGYVRAREQLWVPIALAYGIAALAMAYTRLLPIFASDVLHGGERIYGFLLAAPGVGAVIASLAIARRGRRPGAERLLYKSTLVLVASLVLFAWSRSTWVSLAALAVVGGAQMVFRTTAISSLHEATDEAHRGRVIALFIIDYGLWSFGVLWLGLMAELVSPRFAVSFGALSCLAATGITYWVSRRTRVKVREDQCASALRSSSSWF